MDTVSRLLSCALAPLCSSLYNQYNYIRKFKEHKENFEKEVEQLKSRGSDISDEVDRGKQRHGKNPKREVELWLGNWQKLVVHIDSTKIENENTMCLRGGCPNCYLRWKRGKRIEKLMNEVRHLQEKSQFSDGLFADSLPEVSFPATTLHGGSAERKKDEILNCIMDAGVSKIGVYGMGGVGKTTIMRQIYNQLKGSRDFDSVIWVTVSSSFNLEKLQDKIAKLLGCELSSSTDETSRAMVLHEAFMRRKNFVIILDDVWDEVSLQDVGIPEPDRSSGSKIVWTTRLMNVCNSMESQKTIKVEGLKGEEAWNLFKDKVGGEHVLLSPAIEEIARQVADECAGLPLALITVGRALRNTAQLEVWRNALQELKSSSNQQIDGMGKNVFSNLKFSYNQLSTDKVRSCFLYCALYPEDDNIFVDELIEYWMAEGLIDEAGSIKREKDKGHAILKELKDACMIESGRNDEYVKLHDLIRDLAINITREREQPLITSEMEQPPLFMVKAGIGLKESPKEEEWVEGLERVSLMHNDIETFEGQPNCPQLSTLLLQWTNYLRDSISLSDTFFKNMHKLRVLDFSWSRIESLPNSLSDLVNLHALILTGCLDLKCLPSLAKLHKLRQLKLGHLSSLQELPHGLENLVKLRHLDISDGGWGSCPSGALSKMTCLEVLFLQSDGWRLSYGHNGDGKDNSTFAEIISLKNLTRFSVDFTDILTFNSYITKVDRWKCLDYFSFGIESLKYDGHGVEYEIKEKIKLPSTANHLKIEFCDVIQLSDIFCCHKETFKNLSHLFIFDCQSLKYLMPLDLLENNLANLEEIHIRGCSEMEGLFAGEASAAGTITLPKLKKLVLEDLPALTSICQEKLVCDSLCEMKVKDCPNMKKLPFLMNNVPAVPVRVDVDKEWWEALEWDDQHSKEQLHLFFQHAAVNAWFKRPWIGATIEIAKVDAEELKRLQKSMLEN